MGTKIIQVLEDIVKVDSSLSSTSENPVQNKIINAALASIEQKTGEDISVSSADGTSISAKFNAIGNQISQVQSSIPTSSVLYTAQTLTEAQQAQAKANLGIASGDSWKELSTTVSKSSIDVTLPESATEVEMIYIPNNTNSGTGIYWRLNGANFSSNAGGTTKKTHFTRYLKIVDVIVLASHAAANNSDGMFGIVEYKTATQINSVGMKSTNGSTISGTIKIRYK